MKLNRFSAKRAAPIVDYYENSIQSNFKREVKKRSSETKDLVFLDASDPNFLTFSHVRNAAKTAIDEGYTHYTHINGSLELREAIAEKLRKDNMIEANPLSEVIVTSGSTPAMCGTLLSLINPGDEVVIPDPIYKYPLLTRFVGGIPIPVPVEEKNNFKVTPEQIERKISSKTKMIILNSPHHPTGAVLEGDDLKKIAEIAIKHDLLVMSDEIYEKIIFNGHKHISIASISGMEDRTITINGFSKSYVMTGWRIGYLTADESLVRTIEKITSNMTLCPNSIAQKAALAALLNNEATKKEHAKMMNEFQKRREILVNGLNSISGIQCLKQAGSIFTFPNIKYFGMSSLDLATFLLREGNVSTCPGSVWGSNGEGYLSVGISTSQENIREGLKRMKATLKKIK